MNDETTAPKDAPATMEIPIDNDNKIILQRKPPFHFIYMHLEKGTLPEKFQGAYTNFEYARDDALRYIDQRTRELEQLEAKAKRSKAA